MLSVPRWNAEIEISVATPATISYKVGELFRPALVVGAVIPPASADELGVLGERLDDRLVAFFLLVALDARAGEEHQQRMRIAERLGMSVRALRKWAERTVSAQRGRILRWEPKRVGRQTSRTGGPWWLAARRIDVLPDTRAAVEFIEQQGRLGHSRRADPSELLLQARQQLHLDNWAEALVVLEEAAAMFRRRRRSRADLLWHEILLQLGHARMQLGTHGLRPHDSYNILRSISKQSLTGPEANLVRARAHHLAALVSNQRTGVAAATAVIEELRRAQDVLRGMNHPAADRKMWEIRAYEEICLARLNATARPKPSSVILQASEILPEISSELRMRYGESLLLSGRPTHAIEYIAPAAHSGQLSTPAWVIAERLTVAAQWGGGAPAGPTLDALEVLEQKVRELGFKHQLRLIRKQKKRVRERVRKPTIR